MTDKDIIVAMHTKNDCYKAARPIIGPKGIVVHSTAAPNPWLKRYVDCPSECGENTNNNHWNRSSAEMGRSVCAHAFIGYDKNKKIRVAQILPYNYQNWLTGGSANKTHIGFEICEPTDLGDKAYFTEMWDVVVQYCAYLCRKFNLDPLGENVIIDHATAHQLGWGNNHGDVKHWWPKYFGVYLDELRRDVKSYMDHGTYQGVGVKVETPEEVNRGDPTLYTVQVGAFKSKANAQAMLEKIKAIGFDGFVTTKNTQAEQTKTVKICGGNWNIRTEPNVKSSIIGLAKDGEVYQTSGKTADGWTGILYEGASAWINNGGIAEK